MIAAPLKLVVGCSVCGGGGGFPRSYDRGPIEADDVDLAVPHGRRFPRSYDRGPIEATYALSMTYASVTFPRSYDRGPIEASSCPSIGQFPGRNFRDHMIAAPLKLR